MRTFLQELAERLLTTYGNDLSSLAIMFPSQRARTFFNAALSELCDKPLWQPSWQSIDSLMEQIAGISKGERIRLVSELYKIYVKYHPSESFDKFYFWGEMLIADFDMIDKYLIDASQLLRNINEIKELEADLSYLTPEQERIIAFWRSLGTNETLSEQKRRFLEIWNKLPLIYNEFRSRLMEIGIGYSGMIYRAAAERIKRGDESIDIPKKRYIVAGFNALSASEKVLFDYLRTSELGAEFFWDYDNYYVGNKDHEAGLFLRNNLDRYPSSEGISSDSFTATQRTMRATACVSNVVQVKRVADILKTIPAEQLDKRTAIVLTDENMLIPLLHSLPEEVEMVNVTMGYPLKTTPAYTLIERLIALQSHSRKRGEEVLFYHADVMGLLSHTYITDNEAEAAAKYSDHIVANHLTMVPATLFDDNTTLRTIFSRHEDWHSLAQHIIEVLRLLGKALADDEVQSLYLHTLGEETAKCMHSVEKCNIELSIEIFEALLRRHLQTLNLAFEGEPLEGVQVMGILETRNLDFENVIILSMTDANFPGDRTKQSSFIPYNLRLAYGMPTPEEQEAMYAYYFYRLIQRAQRVDMLYCSRADEKSTGERSRYIYQLEYESPHTITKRSVGVDLNLSEPTPIIVEKGEKVLAALEGYLSEEGGRRLSPTALFRYVECPLKFYFASIAHLSVPDEVNDTIDALTFGNILHETMEALYTPLIGIKNPQQRIAELRKREVVEAAVDKTISRLLSGNVATSVEDFSGDTLLVRDIIVKYIMRGIMRYDIAHEGFTIEGLEDEVNYRFPLADGRSVGLYGRADRIDRLADGRLQIIDYKSGNRPHLEFAGIDTLFTGAPHERISNIFQTLLYSMMLQRSESTESTPSLFYASKMLQEDYSPFICDKSEDRIIERYSDVGESFEAQLTTTLNELFDPTTPFKQCDDVDMCKYCDFKRICRR